MAIDPADTRSTTMNPDLNRAANHDIGVYDPAAHDDQIVAMYETEAEAEAARQHILSEFPQADAQVVHETADRANAGVNTEGGNRGFWGSLKGLFAPDDEVHGYAEGVRRGHALLVVHPQQAQRQRLIDILESTNPVDFDARLEEWRSAGWSNLEANRTTNATSQVSATAPAATGSAATTGVAGGVDTGLRTGMGTDEDVIPVMDERLRVGKRDVSRGGVRVRTYIAERPVEEHVQLRQEDVHVERRPVDRPVGAEDAFRDRTIEVTATGEEAVVAKDARVVEEIAVRKTATERDEVVRDTVRHTEVEVEDERTTGTAGVTGVRNPVGTTTR